MASTVIECPECGERITVPIHAEMALDDEGGQYLKCEPDLTDVWAHSWSHEA